MKKYIKPELFYENFELSQHVAKCGWDVITSNMPETCGAIGDTEFFNEPFYAFVEAGVGPCDFSYRESDICYMPGAADDANKVFNS